MSEPTQHQQESIDFIIDSIINKKDVIGFIAPGGCGKTFSLKHILSDSRLKDYEMTLTATTNKAASIMKSEGIKKAKTLHSAISTPIPTEMFKDLKMLFELKRLKKEAKITEKVKDFIDDIGVKEKNLFDYQNENVLLAENNISAFDDRVFSHYSTVDYKGGVVFVDESSMLPTKSQYDDKMKMKAIGLDAVKKVFDTVILVGDDAQLPPIKGKSSFNDIEKTVLTKNMRADKSLLRLLDCARNGDNLANFVPESGENVRIIPNVTGGYYDMESLIKKDVAHIVYRNNTRKGITKLIRGGLSHDPKVNEPIVYKGANIDEPGDS
ncbi:MAG: hypothetical protein DRQ78_11940, partial [Epsilonproteobacteria bacterium]